MPDATEDELLDAVGAAFSRLRRRTMQVPVSPPVARTDLRRDLVLNAVAETPDGITVNQLAARLMVDQSVASRMATSLIQQGLLKRRRAEDDARLVMLTVTGEGRATMRVSRNQQREAFEYITRAWSDHDRLEFARLLIRYADDSNNAS